MTLSAAMRRLSLAHDNAFLIPAEMLGQAGLSPELAECLLAERRLTPGQLACLEQGFGLYWDRCRDLFARAPRSWFPPRRLNLLLVSDNHSVVPYFESFGGSSAMLYVSDLDTHPEYVAYQFAHFERLSLLHLVRPSVAYNLSWWLERDDASCAAFAAAAAMAGRPDARVFVLLAESFDWIRTLLHDPLRPPQGEPSEPYFGITGADLYVPKRLQPALMALCEQAEAVVAEAMSSAAPPPVPTPISANRGALDDLCDWMRESRAPLILMSPEDGAVWTPGTTDPDRLRACLAESTNDSIRSLHADLQIANERTLTFFSAMRDPGSLPVSCGVLETGGGTFIDPARRAIVYEFKQQTFDARRTPAPPLHRLGLGARVMHEWGHLAHAGKYLRVPESRKPEYQSARAELGERFLHVLRAAPARIQDQIEAGLGTLSARALSPQSALAKKTLGRVGDYLSNLMMSRLIPVEEMQAYVRVNVRHHLDERLDLISELARYAYEIQYLSLAALDRSYFYESSWFNDYFIDSGLVQRGDIEHLFDAVAAVLACYEIDDSKLRIPPAPIGIHQPQ